jgi:F0F1-type ATP synthase membrane subunit b/b'
MDNDEVLGHLLKIESEAATLVNDAQTEADRRIAEAEKQNRASYEERYQTELERLENEFQKYKEQIRRQYLEEIDAYRKKISSVDVDAGAFSALMDRLFAEEG